MNKLTFVYSSRLPVNSVVGILHVDETHPSHRLHCEAPCEVTTCVKLHAEGQCFLWFACHPLGSGLITETVCARGTSHMHTGYALNRCELQIEGDCFLVWVHMFNSCQAAL